MAETYYSLTDIVKLCDNLCAAMPTSFFSGIWKVRNTLYRIPAADVVPVVRGKWQSWTQDRPPCKWYSCDYCGFHSLAETPYCPNCGARMDGDANVQNWEKNHLRPTNMSGTKCEPCKPTQPECGDCEYIKDGDGDGV